MSYIYDIDGNILNSSESIESYYETELATTISSVKAVQTEPCLTFALVTDVHYDSVDTVVFPNTVKNIKALSDEIRLDGILCLGDMTDGDGTQSVTTARLDTVMTLLHNAELPIYFTSGNHDCNAYGSNSYYFTTAQMYQYYYTLSDNNVFFDSDSYGISYYKDFDNYNIRLIALDATNSDSGSTPHYKYSASTTTWFVNTAIATVPDGYSVMLITHLSPTASHNWNSTVPSNASSVLTAINSFISDGGTIFEFIGHSHSDYSFDDPYLEIATHCNKMDYSEDHEVTEDEGSNFPTGAMQWAGTYGDATEDCWDVVVIKPKSRTINMIRFGRGEDRSFTY